MRLSEFILREMEAILVEWEAFAGTLLPAASGMSPRALRDHARQILEAVARDLSRPQTRRQQSEKSKGRAPDPPCPPETAAETHAVLRAGSGFDINQLVAEYRALRASVLRLWLDTTPFEPARVEDVIRFNEAIDQAIAESVGHFDEKVEQGRNLLLGMLGHDMRNPLNNIVITAEYLTALNAGEKVSVAASRLILSGVSMQALLDDLVDFNALNLGVGLGVAPCAVDLARTVVDELEQLQGAHPDRRIDLTVSGDVQGWWDGRRVQQLLRNLVINAIRHGAQDAPVHVVLRGEAAEVRLEVVNRGPAIEGAVLRLMFDPLRQGAAERRKNSRDGLGLGLFIVREIAKAHGGEVAVRSDGEETAFTVRLPREWQGAAAAGAS